jgi:hypothetical protein
MLVAVVVTPSADAHHHDAHRRCERVEGLHAAAAFVFAGD